MNSTVRKLLDQGQAIPASPLALNSSRKFDERRQRALWRYYSAAGAGGLAIGVHTTQFAIHDKKVGLYKPLLALGADEMNRLDAARPAPLIRIAGVCGLTPQAAEEATIARDLGYHAALLNLSAMRDAGEGGLVEHCRTVSQIIPLVGFYLQRVVSHLELPYSFWRRFAEIENVVAIKAAPFDRYATLDVMRAIAESGRSDIALYTGNDDNIVMDLLTPFRFDVNGRKVERRFVGGLLGHWAVWMSSAVRLLNRCHAAVADFGERSRTAGPTIPGDLVEASVAVTDCNSAFFDSANRFAGCIAGLHEVLRRQGLFEGVWLLDEHETLGPGQLAELDRVCRVYPDWNDDAFVAAGLDKWLK